MCMHHVVGVSSLVFPALTLLLRSGQAGWANLCRASGAEAEHEFGPDGSEDPPPW
jgi:hypothetical protein